jgi:hypothetical protein
VSGGSSPPIGFARSWRNKRQTRRAQTAVPSGVRVRLPPSARSSNGDVAHLVERPARNRKAAGSIPAFSTDSRNHLEGPVHRGAGSDPAANPYAVVAQLVKSAALSRRRSRVRIPSGAQRRDRLVWSWRRPAKPVGVRPSRVQIPVSPPGRRSSVGQSAELITPRSVVRSHSATPRHGLPWGAVAPFPLIDFIVFLGNSPVAGAMLGYLVGRIGVELARRAGPTSLSKPP